MNCTLLIGKAPSGEVVMEMRESLGVVKGDVGARVNGRLVLAKTMISEHDTKILDSRKRWSIEHDMGQGRVPLRLFARVIRNGGDRWPPRVDRPQKDLLG